MTEMVTDSERIVILGAGVAGLRVAQKLGRRLKPSEAQIILIDENDYHQYLYRIHEVCNLEYEDKEIIVPLSRILSKRVDFRQASVQNIDPEGKIVTTDNGNAKVVDVRGDDEIIVVMVESGDVVMLGVDDVIQDDEDWGDSLSWDQP